MGVIRLLLALSVVNAHGANLVPAHDMPDGRAAVQLFYVISGFYMSLVLNERYVGAGSTRLFYLNRFLRLWPTYAVVAAGSIALFVMTGEVRLYRLTMPLPAFLDTVAAFPLSAQVWLAISNVLVVGQDLLWFVHIDPTGIGWAPFLLDPANNGPDYALLHPTFSVAIEAMFYAAAPFLLRRSAWAMLAFVGCGVGYHLALFWTGHYDVAWSYQAWPSAIAFFGFGWLAYRLLRSEVVRGPLASYAVLAMLLPVCVAPMMRPWHFHGFPPMLLSAAAFAGIVAVLFTLTRASRIDRWVGELSYSVYLVHIPVLYYAAGTMTGARYGIVCTALVLLLAILLQIAVEGPVERWRHRSAVPCRAASTLALSQS